MDVSEPSGPQPRIDLDVLARIAAPRRMRRSTWILGTAALALAGAAVVGWLAISSSAPSADRLYVTQPVVRGDIEVLVTATGSVQPVKKVDVSSELSGTVRQVLVDYNSKVAAGQRLALLDTDKLEATVENARAKLVAAKAQLVEANATVEEKRRDYERKRTLVEQKVASLQDRDTASAAFDRAVAARDSARAAIAVAEADVKLAELNLSKACICSPIDGVVLKRNVDPGQTVASSFQAPILFSIAQDLTRMEIQVDVDEADVGQVREGQPAVFGVDAYPDRKFDAALRTLRYASETVQGVVTYKAVLDVDNSAGLLRPGMTATAEIVVQRVSDAVLVPNAALRFSPASSAPREQPSILSRLLRTRMPFQPAPRGDDTGPRAVWQLRDGNLARVPVVPGATDGRRTVIAEGALAAGDAVIVDSAPTK